MSQRDVQGIPSRKVREERGTERPIARRSGWTPKVLGCLLALLGCASAGGARAQEASAGQSPAEAQGCLASQCHEYRMAFWQSPHGALDTAGLASRAGKTWSCAACHGEPKPLDIPPGTPGCQYRIFSFGVEDPPDQKSARCLVCHATDHPDFGRSGHARVGLDCTTCHSIHETAHGRWPLQREVNVYDGDALRSEAPGGICVECHAEVFSEFEHAEGHRLQEGVVVCTDCHDPHRPQNRLALGGFKQEACANCHRDKNGPYLFEHAASRVEGCVTCHTPHGSPNRHTLHFQQVAELCFSCHVSVPSFHSRFTLDTQCTNCHSTIHGSNLDPLFLK